MQRLFKACTLVAILISAKTAIAAKDGPLKDIPELQVLHQYVGTWDVAVNSGQVPILIGEAKAEWILDGRYLQQTASLQPQDGSAPYKFTTLMTYDTAKKTYRNWTFVNNGSVTENDGVWNAKARKLTWTSHKNAKGHVVTTTADFSQPGIEKVRIVTSDPVEIFLKELTAENKRRK